MPVYTMDGLPREEIGAQILSVRRDAEIRAAHGLDIDLRVLQVTTNSASSEPQQSVVIILKTLRVCART